MNKLNHYLKPNDGYGGYSFVIASQAKGDRIKRLIGTTSILVSEVYTTFSVSLDDKIIFDSLSFESAKLKYNQII